MCMGVCAFGLLIVCAAVSLVACVAVCVCVCVCLCVYVFVDLCTCTRDCVNAWVLACLRGCGLSGRLRLCVCRVCVVFVLGVVCVCVRYLVYMCCLVVCWFPRIDYMHINSRVDVLSFALFVWCCCWCV